MKWLSLSVLAGLLATPAMACDLCSIYSATQARGEIGQGFFVSVAEQFTHYGTLYTDSARTANPAGQYMNSSVSQVVMGYNLNDRFGLQFNVPIISRSFQRADGFNIDKGTVTGLGDVSLTANVILTRVETKNFTLNWTLLGGIKMPTGDTARLHEEVDALTAPPPPAGAPDSAIGGHDLTLGTGSFDGIIGTGIYTRWHRAFLTANVQYAIRSTGSFDYRYANDLTCSGGPGVYLILADDYTVSAQLNISGEDKGRDTFQGVDSDDTGISTVYVGPQIQFTWKEKLSAEVGVDLPVYIHSTALQAVPDYRVQAGVTWRF